MNLSTLAHLGVAVALLPHGELRLEAPAGVLTDQLVVEIAKSKASLLEELARACERVNLVNMDSSGQPVAKDGSPTDPEVHGVPPPHPQPPVQAKVDPDAWLLPRDEYHAHHAACLTCQAAGLGAYYGERCSTGMVLWTTYQNFF